jgi:RNA-directed DNA polymerase
MKGEYAMNQIELYTTGPVPEMATQPEDTDMLWQEKLRLSKGSRLVWTERMLEALVRGNEGRQWHTLIDKVYSQKTLNESLCMVVQRKGAPGVDWQTTRVVERNRVTEVQTLERLLREDRYEPQPVRRVWIDKPGSSEKRPLGIPTVRDRIVQTALRSVMEPIFEQSFSPHSYGFRPGRSAQQAIARVETLLESGKCWVVDADIKGYFDNIPQAQLQELVGVKIADKRVLRLVEKFLRQGVLEQWKGWSPTETGTPQGAVISPLLANIYLDPLDHEVAAQGYEMIRYADDFVILCSTQAEAEQALEQVRGWMAKAGLTLHPEKTRIVDATQRGGFEFLGWHFERGMKWPRDKSVKRLKESLRKHTPRNSGSSMKVIIGQTNRVIQGWGNYFKGGVRTVAPKIDGWLRGRLRSIKRARDGRHGRGRGLDHNRYPNAYFVELGMVSLLTVTHPGQPQTSRRR